MLIRVPWSITRHQTWQRPENYAPEEKISASRKIFYDNNQYQPPKQFTAVLAFTILAGRILPPAKT